VGADSVTLLSGRILLLALALFFLWSGLSVYPPVRLVAFVCVFVLHDSSAYQYRCCWLVAEHIRHGDELR
jgi:hypothetical protein